MRADANRNRERLLAAAADLFRERGLDVSMEDVAHRAGVGVGTLYRRFHSRGELIDALFEDQLNDLAAMTRQCAGMSDPWNALLTLFERSLEAQAGDKGLKQLLLSQVHDRATLDALRDLVADTVAQLVERAQAAGTLRQDVTAVDVRIIGLQVGFVADLTADRHPDAWRRALALAFDGLRVCEDTSAPPGDPLRPDALDVAVKGWRPPRQAPG